MLLPIQIWREIAALIYSFTCEITKLPWQRPVRVSAKITVNILYVMNEDVRALKDNLENLNTRKSTSRRVLSGILSKTICKL